MLDKSKTYLIVGLGLLGGKYAQVLSQKGYNVTGITHSQSTLDYALQHDYIRAGKNADFEDLVREADCIIFGLYPTVLLDCVKQYGQLIRPGTMVTDVIGVKRGVLEPVQAGPVIIEDNVFVGARSEVVEGVIIEENAVLSMGVYIGMSTKIYDRETGEVTYGRVPSGAVVVPGSLPSACGKYSLYCAVTVKRVDAQTRAKTGINELLRGA